MNALETMLSQPVVERLGLTLVHFAWQGALVAVILAVMLFCLRNRSPNGRYLVACAALVAMAVLPVLTFPRTSAEPLAAPAVVPIPIKPPAPPPAEPEGAALAARPVLQEAAPRHAASRRSPAASLPSARTVAETQVPPPVPAHVEPWTQRAHRSLKALLPWLVCGWLLGVLVLSIRLLGGWLQAHRLKRRRAKPVDARWRDALGRLAQELGVSRPVELLESALARVPTAIGWLRPVILLPASALTGLSPWQLEAILAHELAHIRRHDYLVNLLQSVVETLLFYHPAVWWVSRRIRVEREHCCDDLAVSVCGDAVTYARALADLEQVRAAPPQPAVAAGGGLLLHRIRRLVDLPSLQPNRPALWVAGLVAVVTVLAIGCAMYLSGLTVAAADKAGNSSSAISRVENPVWEKHVRESESLVAGAADSKDYEKAARLCEHLLGDFERSRGYLLQRWERLEKTTATFPKWGVCRKLALCNAHAGDFDAAQSWLDRMRELIPSRSLWPWEKEIALCKTWVPRREAAGKSYAQSPSLESARDLLRAHTRLDEFAAARRIVEDMERRFAAHAWLKSEEFQSIAGFAKAYAVLPKPQTKPKEPQVIPAKDPRIDPVFDRLEANRNRQVDFAWAKWSRMTAIEKAKYINLREAQQTVRGARWEPTQEEAEAFLRARKITDKPGPEERERLRQLGVYDGASLTKEESRPFEQDESLLVAELAALGEHAIPDLLAKIQPGFWPRPTRASLEADWAQMALGRMGNVAVPVLEREIEKVFKGQSGGGRPWVLMKHFVNALASIGTAEAIPGLRRSLDFSDRSVRYDAIRGLGKIPGGLTQELLLELWETCNDYNRRTVANMLGARGDSQALAILERDVPTAYANARYQAEDAIWRIKSRLGMEPGDRPEPIRSTKKGDTALLWEGVEKSVESPNKAIRAAAFEYLKGKARTPQDLEPLIRAMKTDPDRGTRALAAGSMASAFAQAVRNTTAPLQFAEAFDALADAIANGDEPDAIAGLAASGVVGRFKDRPGYDGIVRRTLSFLDSPSTSVRAQCLNSLQLMLSNDPEGIRRRITPGARKSIVDAVKAGLPTDYGRYTVDAIRVARAAGITEAIPNLTEIAGTHQDPYRRRDAAQTLGAIADARAIPALERMARSDPFVNYEGTYENREAAWQAIRAIRERESRQGT